MRKAPKIAGMLISARPFVEASATWCSLRRNIGDMHARWGQRMRRAPLQAWVYVHRRRNDPVFIWQIWVPATAVAVGISHVVEWRSARSRQHLAPPVYSLTRALFLRSLGVIYCCAFVSLWPQAPGLYGNNGLAPATAFLQTLQQAYGRQRFWRAPTLL